MAGNDKKEQIEIESINNLKSIYNHHIDKLGLKNILTLTDSPPAIDADNEKQSYWTYPFGFKITKGSILDSVCDFHIDPNSSSFLIPASDSFNESFYIYSISSKKDDAGDLLFENWDIVQLCSNRPQVLDDLRESIDNDPCLLKRKGVDHRTKREIAINILKHFVLDLDKLPTKAKGIILKTANDIPNNLIPIPFFGDLLKAEIAGFGLNPSNQEFWDKDNYALPVKAQRFDGRDKKEESIFQTCSEYFIEGNNPYWQYFSFLSHAGNFFNLQTRNDDLKKGKYVHFDFIWWPTARKWNELNQDEKNVLKKFSWDKKNLEKIFQLSNIKTVIITSVNDSDPDRSKFIKELSPQIYQFNHVYDDKKLKISYHEEVEFLGKKVTLIGINKAMGYINCLSNMGKFQKRP